MGERYSMSSYGVSAGADTTSVRTEHIIYDKTSQDRTSSGLRKAAFATAVLLATGAVAAIIVGALYGAGSIGAGRPPTGAEADKGAGTTHTGTPAPPPGNVSGWFDRNIREIILTEV